MCDAPAAERLKPVLAKIGLPLRCRLDREELLRLIKHDKKADGGAIIVTRVHEPGSFYFSRVAPESIVENLDVIAEGGTDL